MVVKHVFLFPVPHDSESLYHYSFLFNFFSHSPFMLLHLDSQEGINSTLYVTPLSFFFICHSIFKPSHAIAITLRIHYLAHASLPPHPSFHPCCQVYMVYVSIYALTLSVYSLLSVSCTLCCAPPLSFALPPISLCVPSEWYQQHVACLYSISITLPTTKVNCEWERERIKSI